MCGCGLLGDVCRVYLCTIFSVDMYFAVRNCRLAYGGQHTGVVELYNLWCYLRTSRAAGLRAQERRHVPMLADNGMKGPIQKKK